MEAGIEHLGRGTAASVDRLIIVVEPGSRSLETALRIKKLALETGIKSISVIGNKARDEKDRFFLKESLEGFDFLGFVPFNGALIEADQKNRPFYELCPEVLGEGKKLLKGIRPAGG
jgi:CO dehydrogenase maturation factor